MLLTKECDYAIRTIRILAAGERKTVRAICDAEHIPYKYAYKILKKLQKAGLVQNKRGPTGGYYLIRTLNSFNIYDIISAVDERIFLCECLRDGSECPLNTKETPCLAHHEFVRLQSILIAEMKAKTIEEVLQIDCKQSIPIYKEA